MPTYSHQCRNCGKLFEDNRSYNDSEKKPRCPNCKSRNTKKIIGDVAVIFKGDGFTKSNQ